MAKDKKKKKKDKKPGKGGQAAKRLRTIVVDNPAVANIIASALVATAAAIKDPAKARKLAAQAGDQLSDLAKGGVDRGNAMWQLALDVGRRALDEFGVTETPTATPRAAPKRKAAPKRAVKAAPKRAVKAAPKRVAKAAPKRAVKAAPKRAVKAAPKRAMKAAPKRATKTAAKSAPKVVRKKVATRSTRPKK